MVVSKAELKKYMPMINLKLRCSAKALDLLKDGADDHEVAEQLLSAAAEGS